MTIKAPRQDIMYIPKFWQVIKLGWIKYFALFIIFYYVLYEFFLNYIITEGAFQTVECCEVDLAGLR